jgi:hypothetical protein
MRIQLRNIFSVNNLLAVCLVVQQRVQACLGARQIVMDPDLTHQQIMHQRKSQAFALLRYASLFILLIACPSLLDASQAQTVLQGFDDDAKAAGNIFETTGIWIGVVIGLCFVIWGLSSEQDKLKKVGGGVIIIVAAASFKSAMKAFSG